MNTSSGSAHFEFLVEEPSMEAFLGKVLPKLLDGKASFATHVHRGKNDLIKKLPDRLRGYKHWIPSGYRIVALLDKDSDDCLELKASMESAAQAANLVSRSKNPTSWQIVNRIAVEELEAWFFGEWSAVKGAYAGIKDVGGKQAYKLCDNIKGGTWEAFERILQAKGFYKEGLRKVEAASLVGGNFDPEKCISPSFCALKAALIEML